MVYHNFNGWSVNRPNEGNLQHSIRREQAPIEKGLLLAARIGHRLTGLAKPEPPTGGGTYYLAYKEGFSSYLGTVKQLSHTLGYDYEELRKAINNKWVNYDGWQFKAYKDILDADVVYI